MRRWVVEPPTERDTRPTDTYDVMIEGWGEYVVANLTFAEATAVVDAHNAEVDA